MIPMQLVSLKTEFVCGIHHILYTLANIRNKKKCIVTVQSTVRAADVEGDYARSMVVNAQSWFNKWHVFIG